MPSPRRVAAFPLLFCALVAPVACSGASDDSTEQTPEETTTTTSTQAPTTTTSAGSDDAAFLDTLTFLAEQGDGRDNLSDGSRVVQQHLVAELEAFAQPLPGTEGFLHPFDQGTNVIGMIPGTTRSSELVVLGAHYDHLGHDCPTDDPADVVCDGAGDNASGVAAVLEIGRRLAADPPARTVVLALWDAEEDGTLGSIAAIRSGVLDMDAVVAYVNWDMQGINLLPSLADTTFVIGAETGGPALESAVAAGTGSTDLQAVNLSILFGQGRSDHAPFADAGVPTVFFTDATSACYHSSQDDMAHLDVDKLAREIDVGEGVARAVADGDSPLVFTATTAGATFADAVGVQEMVTSAGADLDRLTADGRATVAAFAAALDAMVEGGEAAFDEADAAALLGGTATFMEVLTEGACDGYLD